MIVDRDLIHYNSKALVLVLIQFMHQVDLFQMESDHNIRFSSRKCNCQFLRCCHICSSNGSWSKAFLLSFNYIYLYSFILLSLQQPYKRKFLAFGLKFHVNMMLVHVTTAIFAQNGLLIVQNISLNSVFHVHVLFQPILIQLQMLLLILRKNFLRKPTVNSK